MAKITCALRKEQIGLLIQYTASYMRGVDKYNMIDILTPLQKVVGDDIIQYASILPDTISSIMVLDRKTFKKSNSIDQFQELAESFEDYDAVEKYLIDNSIIKKEVLPIETKITDLKTKEQEKASKPSIVVHGTVNGYGLQYSEGMSTSDIKKPEDPRGFLPEQEQIELNKGNSIVKTDKTLDNGNKTISIITPATDIFGRSAVSIYDFEIPTNNNSTAQGIKSIIDNVRKEDLKAKELIDETVKQVKKYIDSNAQLTTPVSAELKALETPQAGSVDVLGDVESTTKALEDFKNKVGDTSDAFQLLADFAPEDSFGTINGINTGKEITDVVSELYHKDKAAGKETNLTKAVEQALKQTKTEQTITTETEVTQEEKEIDGIHFNIERVYDGQHIFKHIKFNDAGKDFHFTERVQALRKDDFYDLLAQNKFEIIRTFGDFSLNDFDENTSDRLIIIARKNIKKPKKPTQ
jgi:hypothetical protein